MATSFPTSLDALTNPTTANNLGTPSHAGQHADANDAIEALQAKVGVNGSAVTTTLDYKVGKIAGGTTGQVLKKVSNTDYDLTWAAEAGGGAPASAQYVVLTADATLTAERVLTAGAAIGITDGTTTVTLRVIVDDDQPILAAQVFS